MTRESAEKHWLYTKKVMELTNPSLSETVLDLCHYLYVEAFLHGAKHEKEAM